MNVVKAIEHEQLKKKTPKINIGDTIKVHFKVKEGTRERIQVFEGIVIKKKGSTSNETFTVRRISYGVGVERAFPVHSPRIEKIEVVRVGKVRRAKLYYLRDRIGKAAKTKEKIGARIPGAQDFTKVDEEEVVETVEAEVVEEAEVVVEASEAPESGTIDAEESKEIVQETVDTVSEETVETVENTEE